MKTEIGFHHCANFADFQIKGRTVKFRHHGAASEGSEVATSGRRRAVGVLSRLIGKSGATFDFGFDSLDLCQRVFSAKVCGGAACFGMGN